VGLAKTVNAGEEINVPLRWNNPHASEMEVNIWIFDHSSERPVVVPIRKPSCSGEGYQDNIVSFTVPADFAELGGKIPGFRGCNQDSKPMCTLQVYSHSVESRTYALGFPLVVPGHNATRTSTDSNQIRLASQDPGLDLNGLRDLCLPATDPSATITSAEPRWARLVSDVFNHAYQNSDYSPYSGQQQELISKNLQASAVNKMVTGNRGELGKAILTREQGRMLSYLQKQEDRVYKTYEALANNIIKRLGSRMAGTGKVEVQQLAKCFRCGEVGSTNTQRLQTNTYIPSFQMSSGLVASARRLVPAKYAKLITESGQVQIYAASMTDLMPLFYDARAMGINYQDAVVKSTVSTMADATSFKKRNANGAKDGGVYAATEAKKTLLAARGCPSHCLYASQSSNQAATAGSVEKPLLKGSAGTNVTGSCEGCVQFFAPTTSVPPSFSTATCFYRQPTAGNGRCGGPYTAWKLDTWGRDNANSWASESNCLARKSRHDAYCGTQTTWTFVEAA